MFFADLWKIPLLLQFLVTNEPERLHSCSRNAAVWEVGCHSHSRPDKGVKTLTCDWSDHSPRGETQWEGRRGGTEIQGWSKEVVKKHNQQSTICTTSLQQASVSGRNNIHPKISVWNCLFSLPLLVSFLLCVYHPNCLCVCFHFVVSLSVFLHVPPCRWHKAMDSEYFKSYVSNCFFLPSLSSVTSDVSVIDNIICFLINGMYYNARLD